ncbi:Hypothetical protein SCF082_LOCUS42020 [Durusdinium trenchii]|uniref:Uncharacterized protein n=1 Tax=Durusdinium trenchii TaxID=1381693 RepID=A0ABP0QLD4_9DINO
MEGEFDLDREVVKVVNADNFRKYLDIPQNQRGPLRVRMPENEDGMLGKAFKKFNHFTTHITEEASERLRKWCKNRFVKSTASDGEVEKEMVKLQEEGVDLKTDHSEGHGSIMEYNGVKEEHLDDVIKTLEEDNVPTKVISALKRAKAMKKNTEGICDYRLNNGLLEHLYVMQILTLRKQNKEFDILIAFFELKLGKPLPMGGAAQVQDGVVESRKIQDGESMMGLSISQMQRLCSYVEARAANHWKKKSQDLLQAEAADDIDE